MNERLQRMGGLQRGSRDEDLALFHDMRARERRNFLYPSKDDIEASPKYDEVLSTFCVSASSKGRDLLTLDTEKNDYDWLLTPPSTPLFPSLDQDVPIVNLSQRRVLTRSTSLSRTARLLYPQEPSPKTHGGNPSPRRPSTASSTSSTTSTNRGRPSSPSLTRSSPTLRASSPCRPTTTTGRNSAAASRPTSRASTPTPRRNNTSPSPASRAGLTNGRSRGKSLSPKLRPWEPSLPGFSAEPPPNLRTSLSDRSIQRGGSQATRNAVTARTRGSFVEASEGNQPQWHTMSPDASGNWSISCAHDQNDSQTSKASVVSSCDDDMEMAESVVSGSTRTSSDSGPNAANFTTRLEDPSFRRCILPAKRQTRPAGTSGDPMPFLSPAARKSYERQQAAQRRSSQTMFRPLLSSAPATSFYTTRPGGMHHSPSSHSLESSVTMNGSSHLRGNEGIYRDIATEAAVVSLEYCVAADNGVQANTVYRDQFSDLGGQEMIKEEIEVNLSLGEEAKEHIQSGSELRAMKESFNAFKGNTNQVSVNGSKKDGHESNDQSSLGAQKEKDETAECSKGKTNKHSSVRSLSAQPVEQVCRNLEGNAEQVIGHNSLSFEDMTCNMDVDTKDLNTPNEGHLEEQHAHKHHKFPLSRGSPIPIVSSLMQQLKECEHHVEENKLKECEHHVEDNKLVTSAKPHSYSGLVGNIASQHGAQRPLTDLGSFRKQSSLKNSIMRSQDGMMSIEKTGSCNFSTSESRGFSGSSASVWGDGQSTGAPCECLMDAVEPAFHSGEPSVTVNKVPSIEKTVMCSESDVMERGVSLHAMHVENINDVMGCNVKSESSATAHHIHSAAMNRHGLLEDYAEVGDLTCAAPEVLMHEVCSADLREQLLVDSGDKLAQQDALSIIATCASDVVSVEQDVVHHGCVEPDMNTHSRRNMDAVHLCSMLAAEATEEGENSAADELVLETICGDDLSKRQQPGAPLLKRNVTLEEATDTILFCSSIIHELVYKAATLAIQDEEQTTVRASGSKREFVTLFGFSGAEHKTGGGKTPRTRNRKRQPSGSAVCETSSYVQKQRMVHRQTPAVTMRQSPMERIENAVMGNNEEIKTLTVTKLQKKKSKLAKRVQCRCSCCMM